MYQTSLTLSLSQGQSHPSHLRSVKAVLPRAAWLMTFILMEMEEEEALDADLDTHMHLRRADVNRLATFTACMLNDSHTHTHLQRLIP